MFIRKEEKLAAIDELLELLQTSDDSGFAVATVSELVEVTLEARRAIECGTRLEIEHKILVLIAPTGALQDTAIDNGWGDKFIELAGRLS